ncbi:MAG: hypothetical protein AUK51_02110 [Comamonadaceae bacterium CG2_30_59_20]|nr:MAG: hypothetical protein AUK51_02110 [Comamonadaceae bacterium CG2_30_59_20]
MQIKVSCKDFGIGRALGFDALQAAAQRLQFLFDYFPIHAKRLSAGILLRYGMKSACSNK